ncbi:hypothetical protein [Parendozoicomonas sp. Alg238-R29]|uniref:hypothetical protein n=1 Tax=Parendozoicomonas sp. Alg238-R29 TaxID=2993446 RepID=UPI00248DED5A|nr:hypothetical protein [Parendozoicomonas sp. Alg238-R29]
MHFRSRCRPECVGQQYRLALSDTYPGSKQRENNGAYSVPGNFPAGILRRYFGDRVEWRQNGQQADLVPGRWSAGSLSTNTNRYADGQLIFNFVKSELQNLEAGSHLISFWVAGEGIGKVRHFDSIEVRVSVEIPETVKISALDDVDLYYRDLSGGWLWKETKFCVFSSNGGWYRMELDGQNNPGGRFQLSSSVNQRMNYRISFKDMRSGWYSTERGRQLPSRYQGSRYPDCGNNRNATIRVEIYYRDLHSVPTDTYTDVLTVTVRAG